MPNHKPIQPACRIFPSNSSFISERTLAMPIHCIPTFSSINKSHSFSSDLMLQFIKLSLNRMVETPYFSLICLNSDTMFSGERIRYVLPHKRFFNTKNTIANAASGADNWHYRHPELVLRIFTPRANYRSREKANRQEI